MADDQTQRPTPAAEAGAPPSEEQLRAQLEEELKRVRVEDVLLQSAASVINLTARRIAKEDERDLGQAKVGIDAVGALVEHLPAQVQPQIRDALSELQMLYAREAGGGSEAAPSESPPPPQQQPPSPPSQTSTTPGGTKVPPKLWTPGRPD
jgi:hypothetical protein